MYSSEPSLDSSLVLKDSRVVEDFAVAVAEDVGGEPAGDAEHAGLEGRGEDGLHEGLAGFEVLAADGRVVLLGELDEGWDVDGEVGRAVGEGDAFIQCGVSVDLRGGDTDVVVLEALLEGLDGWRGRGWAR